MWKRDVSQIISPLTIVEGLSLDYNLHFRLIYGEFVQTFEGSNNTMEPHTVDAVGLRATRNLQGGLRCFSLVSGKVLNVLWKDLTIMKMPLNSIKRIDFIAKNQN